MKGNLLLKGMGVSPGKARGRVVIILDEKGYSKLKRGDILVTRITNPGMTMIINLCGGIICDIGGMTSHPAIISRELGIPAVVSTKIGTVVLTDSQLIEIDGFTGEIYAI